MPITEQDLLDNVIPQPEGDAPAPSPQGESVDAQVPPTEQGTGDSTATPTDLPHPVIEAIRKDLTSKWRETKSSLEEERKRAEQLHAENERLKAIEQQHSQAQEAYKVVLEQLAERERNEVAGRAQLRALYGQLQQAQKDGRIDHTLTPDDLQQIAIDEWSRHQQATAVQQHRALSPEHIAQLAAQQTLAALEAREMAKAKADQERLAKEQAQAVEMQFKADFEAVAKTMPGVVTHEPELRALYEATGKLPSQFYAPAAEANVLAKKAAAAVASAPVVSGNARSQVGGEPWGDGKPMRIRDRMTQILKQAQTRR